MESIPFAHELQNDPANAMDTSPIDQPIPSQLSTISNFLPPITDPADLRADLVSAVFMPPIDPIEPPPSIRTAPPSFIPNFPQPVNPFTLAATLQHMTPGHVISPPQSQIPSPAIHASSAYTLPIRPSIDATLESAASADAQFRRASVSLSPAVVAPSFITPSTQPVSMAFPQIDQPELSIPKTDSPSLLQAEPHILLGEMLNDIAKTASSAGDACRLRHDAEATSKVDELRERISKVSELLSLMELRRDYFQIHPTVQPQLPTPTDFAPSLAMVDTLAYPSDSMDLSGNPVPSTPTIVDQSRKRTSEFEETRTAKAPKRESLDDPLASTSNTDVVLPPEPSTPLFVTNAATVVPQNSATSRAIVPPSSSRPSSRPATPPVFQPHNAFTPVTQSTVNPYPTFIPQTIDFAPALPTPLSTTSPTFPVGQSVWTEASVPSRHHHSLSLGSLKRNVSGLAALPSPPLTSGGVDAFVAQMTPPLPTPPASSAISPPIGRMSRSGSITGTFNNSFGYFNFSDTSQPWPGARVPSNLSTNAPTGPSRLLGKGKAPQPSSSTSPEHPSTLRTSPADEDDDDSDSSSDGTGSSPPPKSDKQPSSEGTASSSSSSDVPSEYRAEVDRIFFEYLNKICSNLDAKDSKGEPIHQTLMAKKMQRLDESPDFRPFKFRIQAFTLAFLEELARQGYPEEKIPMKKVRNYLWRQQYILRFNEDGKKAKSKGNHIWNIEAKKAGDGKWEFRPFHRKLAGTPPSVAYCGLQWSWSPRIWDPQASWQNVPVQYSSPNLPSWLSWKDDVLSGVPPPGAESCKIAVVAKFKVDGREEQLTQDISLTIAPVSALDATNYAHNRRPSLADPPRRSTSDSALFQNAPRKSRAPPPLGLPSTESQDTRVFRVLQNAAQRVTEETQTQLTSPSRKPEEVQDLVKQQHVLEQTVKAYSVAVAGQTQSDTRRLAVAAQRVVLQAAQTVIADKTAANGGIPPPPVVTTSPDTSAVQKVTINELTDATQDAIAEAVKRTPQASTDVDIIVVATSILKARAPGSPHASGELQSTASGTSPSTSPRSHSIATVGTGSRINTTFPPTLPPLLEYA